MKKIILLLLLLITIVSCTNTTPEKIGKLKIGMTQAEAIEILGEPYTKIYHDQWTIFYYSYRESGYKHHLSVYIVAGKVDSW